MSKKIRWIGNVVVAVSFILLTVSGVAISKEWSLKEAAKPYKGEKVRTCWFAVPWSRHIHSVISEFEKETGIKVEWIDYPYETLHEKIATELATKRGVYDIMLVDAYWIPEFAPFLTYLDDFMKTHPELVDPNFDWEDIHHRVLKYGCRYSDGQWGGKLIAFPGYVTNHMLVYRKDLFEDPKYKAEFKARYGYELRPPDVNTTFEQFKDIAEFFTRDTNNDGEIDLYGYCSASARTAVDVIQEWYWYLYLEGGKCFENWEKGKMKPLLNSPAAIRACQDYLEMLKYQPPGVTSFGVFEQVLSFQKGESAMAYTWTETFPDIEDPEKSLVAGEVGYSTMPQIAGQFGPMPVVIPQHSKHKEAAFLLGQWIHSKEIMRKTEIAAPPRVSMLLDPELQKIPENAYYKSTFVIFEKGFVAPMFPELWEWVDIMQSLLSRMLIGEISSREAMETAQEESEELMKRAGYRW